MTKRFLAMVVLTVVSATVISETAYAQWDFHNFESGPVHPVALSPDGRTLAVTNLPDQRIELFSVDDGQLAPRESVRVGIEPVTVRFRTANELWVVNHLSDSVSVIEISADGAIVDRVLQVGDEPHDVVFAGPDRGLAFISSAHRGQSSPHPLGEFETPGVGRADIWVFDATGGGDPVDVLTLFGDRPRALAVSADGLTVYAAVFHSGNGTTAIPESAVCNGGTQAGPCSVGTATAPGGVPGPDTNHQGIRAPETGLIVRWSPLEEAWLDELGRDWSEIVRFELPDYDVFAIDAADDSFEVLERYSGVGTILFNMAVHPLTGDVLVTNTEANNEIRFEGPGDYVREVEGKPEGEPASVLGRHHRARITVIGEGGVTPHLLNPHIDYDEIPVPTGVRERSTATPMQVEVGSDGIVYIAALGSDRIATLPFDELGEEPDTADDFDVSGGPVGFALDEAADRLYVYTRYDNAVVSIDLNSGDELQRRSMFTAEPEREQAGRRFLYDARYTSANGEASCASCHVFGDTDSLAWDLGDPDADLASNPNPVGPIGNSQPFHPMKGPMLTQTLRGLDHHGPLHWRGDRTGENTDANDAMDVVAGFSTFNVAFEGLLGREVGPLTDEEMELFSEFAVAMRHPPNPSRNLDRSLRPDEAEGREIFFDGGRLDGVATCEGCHRTDPAVGFYGTDGRFTFEGEPQEFKVAPLRSMYQRVGMFGMSDAAFFVGGGDFGVDMGPQVRGFGFLHDGSVDTIENFLHADVFIGFGGSDGRDLLEAFMMVFPGEFAPIVGQQVMLDGSEAAIDRATLLLQRAGSEFEHPFDAPKRDCDVVAFVSEEGERERGFVYRPEHDAFQSDLAEVPLASPQSLLGEFSGPEYSVRLLAVPPGSGWRAAVDRDGDRALDGDELAVGTDPTDPSSVPETILEPTDPPWKDDEPVDCELEPTHPDCDPVDCELEPTHPDCEPVDCSEEPSHPDCACALNPTREGCEEEFCAQNPLDPVCVEDPCLEDPSLPECEEPSCSDGSEPPCNSADGDDSGGCSSLGATDGAQWFVAALVMGVALVRRRLTMTA